MAGSSQHLVRVLIVDDALEVRRDLRTALTLTGQIEIVGEAANGLEAQRLAASLQPDVVLLDLEMPVMDGYQAARQIKEHCPACRVLALTVHGYDSARRRAIEAGMDGFLIKGAPLESLVQWIVEGGSRE